MPLNLNLYYEIAGKQNGFYYVGTNRGNNTKLVNIYKRGYASGSLSHALGELTSRNHVTPDVIVCESHYGFAEIRDWADLLSKHEHLSTNTSYNRCRQNECRRKLSFYS